MAPPSGAVVAPARRRVAMAPLVGRKAEVARAVDVLSTPPSVVTLAGESGIGKTRLLNELRDEHVWGGRHFVVGRCHPIREPFPLGPVLEAVRQLRQVLSAGSLSPLAGALSPLLPELADVLPEPLAPLPDRAAERHRVFRGLVELLSAGGPLVLALEDLHWADDQTVDFVDYLLGDPPEELSLVLTQRSAETAARVRALPVRAPARVEVAAIELAPLSREQTGELAASLLGESLVPTGFIDDLAERTAGSPFAIEEMLLLVKDQCGLERPEPQFFRELAVPAAIRDPVLERLDRLTATARSLVEALAVLQTPATADLLATVTGLPGSQARRSLAAALAAGVLLEQGDTVEFRHQLASQAVYEQIVGPRREDLHARAATALLDSDPAALGRAAHHLRRSSQRERWAETAELAADRAVDLGHDEEAMPLYQELLRDAAPGDQARRGRVAVKYARASIESLRAPDVTPLLEALEAGVPTEAAGELRLLAAIMGDWAEAADRQRSLCFEAVTNLDDRPSLQAWAMACLGMPAAWGVSVADHLDWMNRSLTVLPQVDDRDMAMGVLGKTATSLLEVGDPSWRDAQETFLARIGAGSRRREAYALRCHGLALALAGYHDCADRRLLEAAERASGCENPGLDRAVGRSRAVLRLLSGDWHCAEQWLNTHARADPSGDTRLVRGCLALAKGEHGDADHLLGDVALSLQQGWLWPGAIATSGLVQLATSRGDADTAASVVRQLRHAMEVKGMWAPAARALPAMVDGLLASGCVEEATALVSSVETELSVLDAPLTDPAVHMARSALMVASGQRADSARRYVAAAEAYDRLRCPYEAAQARERAATCLLPGLDDVAGARLLRSALDTYRQLGASWALDRAAGLARRHGVSVPARHRGGRRGYGTELSPREAEVARLAGLGHTNAQVAAELFVSVSTVKKHLAAAFRKLDVQSRPALVRRLASADGPSTQHGPTHIGPIGP